MLFNSIQFILFFVGVVILYFATPYRFRWILLLLGSYFFYMCWKVEYILLISASTLVAYISAIKIEESASKAVRKAYFLTGLLFGLGLLFTFKYFNFFNDTARSIAGYFDLGWNVPAFKLLLPVGISFYTFQVISYLVDVYQRKKTAERHLGIFALFVSFFPQLVAGPIERSAKLLPQFFERHAFDYDRLKSGLLLMVRGFIKKVVIADRLALFVNPVFNNPHDFSGPYFAIATVFFVFQVFCDFSGYSDIAIGAARVMGFELMKNFDHPYSSKNMAEFWKRWHISLSSWILDYLYTPISIALRDWRIWGIVFALIVTFTLNGLWHGANWNFVIFGLLLGIELAYEALTKKRRKKWSKKINRHIYVNLSITLTFLFWCFVCIFFRANSMSDLWYIISNFGTEWGSLLSVSNIEDSFGAMKIDRYDFVLMVTLIIAMEIFQYFERNRDMEGWLRSRPLWIRWTVYAIAMNMILFLGVLTDVEFIYFAF